MRTTLAVLVLMLGCGGTDGPGGGMDAGADALPECDEGTDLGACHYEECNGIDDDGDGQIDEPPVMGVGDPCGCEDEGITFCAAPNNPAVGDCVEPGYGINGRACVRCSLEPPDAGIAVYFETCDDVDNDCDGYTDELEECGD